jgi:hypothetical protein
MAGEKWQQVFQVGKETTAGTAVAATRKMYWMGDLTRQRAVNLVKVASGTRDNQRDAKLRAVQAGAKVTQPLSADEMIEPLLACVQGSVTPTTALGCSTWVFKPGNTLDSQTVEFYDAYRGWQLRGALVDEIDISGTVSGDSKVDITYFGREAIINPMSGTGGVSEVQTIALGAASAGTVVYSFNGFNTGSIAFNASNATLQAALVALPSIGAGNVVCSAGPLPASVTVTFGGNLAKQAGLPLFTGAPTGLTGGTLTIARTTAGVNPTLLADRVPNFMPGWNMALYADSFGGTVGTTNLAGTFISHKVTIKNNAARKYFGDNTTATGSIVLGELDINGEIVLEGNAASFAEYNNWEAGTKRLVRILLGNSQYDSVIGTSANKPQVWIDAPCAWTVVDLTPEDAGTKVYKFTFNYVYDPTNAYGIQVTTFSSRSAAY